MKLHLYDRESPAGFRDQMVIDCDLVIPSHAVQVRRDYRKLRKYGVPDYLARGVIVRSMIAAHCAGSQRQHQQWMAERQPVSS